MDVACNDSYFSAPVADYTLQGWWNSSPELESYTLRTLSGLTDMETAAAHIDGGSQFLIGGHDEVQARDNNNGGT